MVRGGSTALTRRKAPGQFNIDASVCTLDPSIVSHGGLGRVIANATRSTLSGEQTSRVRAALYDEFVRDMSTPGAASVDR